MKKNMKRLGVLVLCIVLAGGVGIPVGFTQSTSLESSVVSVQAKSKIRKKFKKAMKEYLSFYKKYCKFMKKYKKSKNALNMLTDYSKLLKQEVKFSKAFKKWKSNKMNSAEIAYYTEVNLKVLKMLSKIK